MDRIAVRGHQPWWLPTGANSASNEVREGDAMHRSHHPCHVSGWFLRLTRRMICPDRQGRSLNDLRSSSFIATLLPNGPNREDPAPDRRRLCSRRLSGDHNEQPPRRRRGNARPCRDGRCSTQRLTLGHMTETSVDDVVLRLAASAYLGRYTGTSRVHSESDLRIYLSWCAERDVTPLTVSRSQVEL